MSKPDSYFDWELAHGVHGHRIISPSRKNSNLSNKSRFNRDIDQAKMKVNSLGIIDKDFKEFIKKWKMKNL
ncbi:hypothetical protein ES703_78220 [subsurface metagenome]